jgi:hypothetical protein
MYGRPLQQSRRRMQEISSYYYENDLAVKEREIQTAMSNRSNEPMVAQND